MKYRADIDGLRALAVLPVVLYHLNIRYVPGGFVGVDVFFVISGYLITKLISAEMHGGTYSVAAFYVRRARRIFPALFLMFAVCSLFALAFYLPHDVATFNGSLSAATLFVSNIYFYLTDDYFTAAAQTKLLLHTWSLAVEEQFYILFPLVLLCVRRWFVRVEKQALTALTLVSLAVSVWLVGVENAAAGFYLLPSRAWELLSGSLLAIGTFPKLQRSTTATALGAIGLGLIAASVLLFDHGTPFPGIAALAPCVGATLVIYAGENHSTFVSRALAVGPARFIGLISYSLYLWHWPIIVAANYYWDPMTRTQKLGVLAASVVAAVLSWYFVERPFRRQPQRFNARRTLSVSAAVMGVLILLSFVIHPFSVRLWNMPAEAERMLTMLDYDQAPMRHGTCFLTTTSKDFERFDRDTCLQVSATKKNYLLIGDSHAASLWAGLAHVNPEANVLQATASGCKPLVDNKGLRYCTDLMRFVIDDFLPRHHLDTIVVTARWAAEDVDGMRATAVALKRYADRVVVFGPTVEYRHALPRTMALSIVNNDPLLVERDRLIEQKRIDESFGEALRGTGIQYFSVYRALCPREGCQLIDHDRMPLQFDYGHFALGGAIYVAQRARQSGAL